MTSANVDLVRSIYEAWGHGDYTSVTWASADIEWVIADGPAPDRWSGTTVSEGWRDWLSAWQDFRIEPEEIRELDDERVLVLTRFTGRGKTSGLKLAEMGSKGLSLFEVRDGKVTSQVIYMNRERGLNDLGLTE